MHYLYMLYTCYFEESLKLIKTSNFAKMRDVKSMKFTEKYKNLQNFFVVFLQIIQNFLKNILNFTKIY